MHKQPNDDDTDPFGHANEQDQTSQRRYDGEEFVSNSDEDMQITMMHMQPNDDDTDPYGDTNEQDFGSAFFPVLSSLRNSEDVETEDAFPNTES